MLRSNSFNEADTIGKKKWRDRSDQDRLYIGVAMIERHFQRVITTTVLTKSLDTNLQYDWIRRNSC